MTLTRIGLQITDDLTYEEWRDLAPSLGEAARSIGFIVGDWLVYGQNLFGTDGFADRRVDPASYDLALASTGLDLSTLQNYAYVSRSIPFSRRSEQLSWEHHRLIAKLSPEKQDEWVGVCEAELRQGRRISTRRLRKSISLGRVASDKDLEPTESDKGIENHIPFVNRLVVWWKHLQGDRFLDNASEEQRQALKRDLEPVISIYNQL